MIGVDQPGAIGDELVRRLQHGIGDGRAFRFRQRVAAASGMEAHTEEFGCFELPVDQPLAGLPRKAILMVECGRATVLYQLGHRRDRSVVEAFLGQPRENGIDAVEPFDDRQLRPVQIGAVSHEALKEVMMGVDEAGIDEPAGGVLRDGPDGQLSLVEVFADGPYRRAVGQDIDIAPDVRTVALVHDDRCAVLQQVARQVTPRRLRGRARASVRAAGGCRASQ